MRARPAITPQRSAIIETRARQMRHAQTPSEAALWARLKGCQIGVVFRRQVPVGRVIADFLAPAVRLIVEVDGGYHRQRACADARRDRALERAGYRVLRLEAEIVIHNPELAVARIVEALR